MPRPRAVRCAIPALAFGLSVTLFTSAAAAGPELSKGTIQTQAAKILAAKTGQNLPQVTCPHGVAAKVGAVVHCTVVPYKMSLQYPVTVTVRSLHGNTAHFSVQVGQAIGQANKAKFCSDNAAINAALSASSTPSAFLAAIQAQEQTFLDLQSTAPSKVVTSAGTLVEAARQAIKSGRITIFNSDAVSNASLKIDKFCRL